MTVGSVVSLCTGSTALQQQGNYSSQETMWPERRSERGLSELLGHLAPDRGRKQMPGLEAEPSRHSLPEEPKQQHPSVPVWVCQSSCAFSTVQCRLTDLPMQSLTVQSGCARSRWSMKPIWPSAIGIHSWSTGLMREWSTHYPHCTAGIEPLTQHSLILLLHMHCSACLVFPWALSYLSLPGLPHSFRTIFLLNLFAFFLLYRFFCKLIPTNSSILCLNLEQMEATKLHHLCTKCSETIQFCFTVIFMGCVMKTGPSQHWCFSWYTILVEYSV